MGFFRGPEVLKAISKTGATTVQLIAGSNLLIGGQGYKLDSSLNVNTGVSGLGGIDIGAIATSNYYYVYVVVSGGSVGLVASLSSVSPTGFLQYRKVGAFNTGQLTTDVEQGLAFGEQPYSMVRLYSGNGHGSSNDKIRRMLTIMDYFGKAITYTDSATAGASFDINNKGNYALSYSDRHTAGSGYGIGFSLNSTLLTTSITGIGTERLIMGHTGGAGLNGAIPWNGNLNETDTIRIHTDGNPNATGFASFTISKIGSDEIDWSL